MGDGSKIFRGGGDAPEPPSYTRRFAPSICLALFGLIPPPKNPGYTPGSYTHIPNFINIASLVAELLPLVDFDYENNYDKLIMGNNLAANEEIFIKFGMWVYLLRKCVEF